MENNKTNIYFTSDWHLGHANCIKFDSRPFKDIDHMHRVLINNYNATIRDQDICYFLGDMGMGKHEHIKNVVSQLNGNKILILGNHDKGVQSMYHAGFNAVMYGATLYIAHEKVTLSHCPLYGVYREDTSGMRGIVEPLNWHGENKQDKYTTKDEGQFHLHGHIHSPNGGKSQKILGKQYDVGVPANKYRPVSQSTIESWISKYGR
jgi:calcineurin-like phosphoesterase family protein